MQAFLVNGGVFINTNGAFENIDRANQDERFTGDRFQVRDQVLDVLSISERFAIGYPFLGRRGRTHNSVKSMRLNIMNIC